MSEEPFSFEKSDRDLELRTRAMNWAIFGAGALAGAVSFAFVGLNSLLRGTPAESNWEKPASAFMLFALPQGGILGVLVFLGVFKQPAVRMLAASGQRGWMVLCGVLMVLAVVAREVVGENLFGRVILQQVTLAVPCAYWAHWQMLRMDDPELPVLPRFSMSTLMVLMFSMAAAGAAFVRK